jgi:ribose transport system ATP-binding protein
LILETKSISKEFPGVLALDKVDLRVFSGQVNAVVGENGAGKSTLMKILSGVYTDYTGNIFLDGKEVFFRNPREAQQVGISIIHQELNLIPNLTVAENIFLGVEQTDRFGFLDRSKMRSLTLKLLDKLELDINPTIRVSDLRVGQQQLIEIARALHVEARILIMDEPTSAISEKEIDILFSIIESLRERNVAVIYITHKLDELFRIASNVTVLRDGKLVHTSPIEAVDKETIIHSMVGRKLDEFFVKSTLNPGEEILRVENLSLLRSAGSKDYIAENVSFAVHQREILGIYGLMGAGRTELFETLFGMHPNLSSGEIFIDGNPVSINSPEEAIDAGIGFVTENRKDEGLVTQMSVAENVSMAGIEHVESFGFLRKKMEDKLADIYKDRLGIKTPTVGQIVDKLSGGNQQKVVLAKWLVTNPRILFLDEPTRGVDVNAKNEIYQLISQLASDGLAVIIISSELPEILAICDRILVLSEGIKTAEFSREEFTEQKIIKAALPGQLHLDSKQS